ncbi:hypothetical protein AAC387_Pa04g1622 [Persea americana]
MSTFFLSLPSHLPIFFSSLLLLLITFHIPTPTAADPLNVICDNTANYTNTSSFGTNLNLLLPSLSSNSTLNYGFYNTSIGQDPNRAYGLVLCRGDATNNTCQNCTETASDEILSRCPNRSATIWYDDCLLRYSNTNFFGSSSNPMWALTNTQNVSDPDQFDKVLGDLMSNLSNGAASEPWLRMFATGQAKFSSFSNVYGLVQCTRDISASDCGRCLEAAISQIPNCCGKKRGGRVVGPVCNIRFEINSFYGDSTIGAPAPSPSPTVGVSPPSTNTAPTTNGTSTGTGGSSSKLIPILVPTIVGAVILSIIVALLLVKKTSSKRKKTHTSLIGGLGGSEESFRFDLDTIRAATNDFSDENKLGQGGFGAVYKVVGLVE